MLIMWNAYSNQLLVVSDEHNFCIAIYPFTLFHVNVYNKADF